PKPPVSGMPRPVTVAAVDAFGNHLPNFTGTVHFTTTDLSGVVPADYTFKAADKGVHTFPVTLKTDGVWDVSVSSGVITGTLAGLPVAPLTNHFGVTVSPVSVTAGGMVSVTVKALTPKGVADDAFTGTVHLTSTDLAAGLPVDYTFLPGDHGSKTFQVTLDTAGKQTITATGVNHPNLKGISAAVTVTAGAAVSFAVSGLEKPGLAGTARTITVAALDAFGNRVTSYLGTVHFTSSDGQAVLPADYVFKAADKGIHTFTATLKTIGNQTVTVTDKNHVGVAATVPAVVVTLTAGLTGPTVGVPGQPLEFALTAAETNAAANAVYKFQIDWDGNGTVDQTVTGPSGTVVSHAYVAAKTYAVKVKAVDAAGATTPVAGGQSVTIQTLALETDPLNPAKTP
ncbi:PKD domain-containing protein, partial [Zavarzinella formosa]|uniref:PKD domain-containing protein n=1 Tax=Zavarzinella formosa TaxID=360055 RepID=UPI00187DD471